jgi:hypothetical protein
MIGVVRMSWDLYLFDFELQRCGLGDIGGDMKQCTFNLILLCVYQYEYE